MAKKITQLRYYGENSKENFPKDLERIQLVSGDAFANVMPITQLGIQTLPGTKFYVNNSPNEIVVGSTGIYELDLSAGTFITNLRFDNESFDAIEYPTAYLIVDIVYEIEEED